MQVPKKISQIGQYIYTYRVIVLWCVILGLLGFTLWQSMKISDPGVDQAYLQQQRTAQEESATEILLDESLRETLNQLERTPVDVKAENLGTNNPFNP